MAQHDERDSLAMLPWYPRDWRASSSRALMSSLARGVYRELLDAAWLEGGSLPADEPSLVALSGCTPAEWRKVGSIVLTRFEICEDGRLRQGRLSWQMAQAEALRTKRRKLAEETNAKRKAQRDADADRDADRSANRDGSRSADRDGERSADRDADRHGNRSANRSADRDGLRTQPTPTPTPYTEVPEGDVSQSVQQPGPTDRPTVLRLPEPCPSCRAEGTMRRVPGQRHRWCAEPEGGCGTKHPDRAAPTGPRPAPPNPQAVALAAATLGSATGHRAGELWDAAAAKLAATTPPQLRQSHLVAVQPLGVIADDEGERLVLEAARAVGTYWAERGADPMGRPANGARLDAALAAAGFRGGVLWLTPDEVEAARDGPAA
jgi:uncharacterized protein YdaU (DUF1376 family)